MRTIRSLAPYAAAIAAVAFATAGRTRAAEDMKAAEKQRQLIGVLQSDAPPAEKAITCKHLAIYGTKAAVPALAPLLADKDLASWARIALEAIPDPAAGDALRAAMGKLTGRLLIGVINSIAVRRDARAVDQLAGKLKDADAPVASAAAEALGRIGGDPAAKALDRRLPGAPTGVRSAVAYGCVLCAERYLAEGKADQAVKLYDTVRKADVPTQRVLEATRGAILARGAAGVPLLVEHLRSADKELFGIALRTARELACPQATDALVTELRRAAPNQQVCLLLALADRGDAKVLPTVIESAKGGQTHVRIAAIGVLERLGNASCVPVLLEAALASDADLATAANGALRRLPGGGVDADILDRLAKASGKTRRLLIEVAARRQIVEALPTMVRCAEDADADVRGAAVAAIGTTGGNEHVADLVRILQKTPDAKEQTGIEKALMALGGRGGAACVKPLMPLAGSNKPALRVIGIHALACAGGPNALAALKAAIDDKDGTVQDEAVRTLSAWPNRWPKDPGVTEPLLALAKSGKKAAHRVLALRGFLQYVQGAKQLKDDDKLAKVRQVLPLITRRDEKRLVISVLRNIRAAGALEVLVTYAADPAVAEEACSGIVNLAGKGNLKGASKDQRRKALQTAAEKSKSRSIKQRANAALKAINR